MEIKKAFEESLSTLKWMDEETRRSAKEKVRLPGSSQSARLPVKAVVCRRKWVGGALTVSMCVDAIGPCDSGGTQGILKPPVAWCQETSHSRRGWEEGQGVCTPWKGLG